MRAEPVIGQRPLAFFHLPRAGRERNARTDVGCAWELEQTNTGAKQIVRENVRTKQETLSSSFPIKNWAATGQRLRSKQSGSIAISSLVLALANWRSLSTKFQCRGAITS